MKKKLIKFGIILILLAVAGGGGYFFLTKGGEGEVKSLISHTTKKGSALISDDKPELTIIKAKDPEPVYNPTKPSFDVIRVSPDGSMVMAGKAEPSAKVMVFINGQKEIEFSANEDGDWVYDGDRKLSAGDYEISLSALNKDNKVYKAEKIEIVSVPKQKDEEVLVVQTDSKGGDTKVRQKPEIEPDKTKAKETKVVIDIIDYDENGINGIAGISNPSANLRLYKNNEFVAEGKADDKGKWRINKNISAQGKTKLRVDCMDDNNKVLSRAETEVDIRARGDDIPFGSIVMVERGSNLWTIARRVYGSGFAYMIIFAANFEQIQNPDLIYPGQLFILPPKDN